MMKLEVTPDVGEAFEVSVNMRTVVAWEMKFPARAMAQLGGSSLKANYIYELAFVASTKSGQYAGDFPTFKESFDVEPVDESDEGVDSGDPTQVAA